MKKSFIAMLSGIFLFAGCEQFDFDGLNDRLDDMDERISRLEELCSEMNTNIEAMESILEALEKKDCITSVTPVEKDGEVVGYTISFEKGEPITIYNGKDGVNGTDGEDGQDGQDGYTPEIGIRKDTDGLYYWTLDGEWLTDESGSKIPVEGKDGEDGQNGQTPEFKIEDGDWYISYDNGQTWKNLGQATGDPGTPGTGSGDCLFKEVIINDEYVTFIMSDGQSYTLPRTVTGDITVNVVSIGSSSAEFSGTVRLPLTGEDGYEVGIMVSSEPSLPYVESIKIPILEKDEYDRYSVSVSGLHYERQYYYSYYIKEDGKYSLGEAKSFVTGFPLTITADVKEVTETTAVISGVVSVKDNAPIVEYGIVYKSEYDGDFRFVQIVPSDDGSYEIELTDLYPDTEYRYSTAVYIIDADCIFGEEKTFFTNPATEIAVNLEIISVRSNSVIYAAVPSAKNVGYIMVFLDGPTAEKFMNDKKEAEAYANVKVKEIYESGNGFFYGYQKFILPLLKPDTGYGVLSCGVSEEGTIVTEIAVLSIRTNPFENMYPDLTFTFENLPYMNSEYSFGVRITPSMEDVLWYAMYVKKSDLEGKDLTDDDIALMAFEEAYMNYDGDFSVQEVARAGAYDLPSSNFYSDSPDGFNALEKGVEYVAVAFAVNGDGDRISPVVMSEGTFASNQ